MDQPLRGLAYTALDAGSDISDRISILYAPPGAWSHGTLWGADVVGIPDGAKFKPEDPADPEGLEAPDGVDGMAERCGVRARVDSATAVRTLNALLAAGLDAELATAPFTKSFGDQIPAGTVLFPASARGDARGHRRGVGRRFLGVQAALPASEPIDRSPRIAVLTGGPTRSIWVLRNLGFTADPVSTATINTAPTDPLLSYDVDLQHGRPTRPTAANPTARARLTASSPPAAGTSARGQPNGANFLTNGGQVTGLTARLQQQRRRGYSGIVNWLNNGSRDRPDHRRVPASGHGDHGSADVVHGDAGRLDHRRELALTGFFLVRPLAVPTRSATAPGAPVIAHGRTPREPRGSSRSR